MERSKLFKYIVLFVIVAGLLVAIKLVLQRQLIRKEAADLPIRPLPTISLNTGFTDDRVLGPQFLIYVDFDPGLQGAIGAELAIKYDPEVLEASDIKPGTFFPKYEVTGKKIDETTGTISFTIYAPPSSEPVRTPGTFAVIEFNVRKSAVTNITFDTERTIVVASDPAGINIIQKYISLESLVVTPGTPTNSPTPTDFTRNTPTPRPTNTTTPTSVCLPGIPKLSSLLPIEGFRFEQKTRTVTLQGSFSDYDPCASRPIVEISAKKMDDLSETGFVNVCTITNPIEGEVYSCNYSVVPGTKYTWRFRAGSGAQTAESVRNLGVTYPGDIDNSGVVDLLDYSILFEHFGTTPPTDARADINDDNIINLLDYSILYYNFGKAMRFNQIQ